MLIDGLSSSLKIKKKQKKMESSFNRFLRRKYLSINLCLRFVVIVFGDLSLSLIIVHKKINNVLLLYE